MLKWLSAALMVGVLITFIALAVSAHNPGQHRSDPVFNNAVLWGPPILLTCILSFYRLYRVRRKEGKKRPLPGYWELGEELWDPMGTYEQIGIIGYAGTVLATSVVLLSGDFTLEESCGSLIVFAPALAFPGVSFIFACYGTSKTGNVENSDD